jgi:uncharacterized protein (DUF608 family)
LFYFNINFFFLVAALELSNLLDAKLELEVRNENLKETVDFLRIALHKLDRKYRKLLDRHSKCKVKFVYLHR